MLHEIKHRLMGTILFAGEYNSLKLCVEAAVKARANLARANLARANLAGADLARADLARANLAGADLARATGIIGAGPFGQSRRVSYSTVRDSKIMIWSGCWSGDIDEWRAFVKAERGNDAEYLALADYFAAIWKARGGS